VSPRFITEADEQRAREIAQTLLPLADWQLEILSLLLNPGGRPVEQRCSKPAADLALSLPNLPDVVVPGRGLGVPTARTEPYSGCSADSGQPVALHNREAA
jgi:hypothetical protein